VAVSGYFNPLHVGHLALLSEAATMGTDLIVIVNNDVQQMRKKGKIIQPCDHRILIVRHLRMVDAVYESVDVDDSVCRTLRQVRAAYDTGRFIFANGGDRSDVSACTELEICRELDIDCVGGVGGAQKLDSSSRINQTLGIEQTQHRFDDLAHDMPGH
jgi:cytidyltransferase-like protein